MAIRKRVKRKDPNGGDSSDLTMPVMSYDNPGLAKLIVEAWANNQFKRDLLDRHPNTGRPTQLAYTTATTQINAFGGLELKRALVITEKEHDDDYVMQHDDEVVFVLPNETRALVPNPVPSPPPVRLLETARMLMACTPNGI